MKRLDSNTTLAVAALVLAGALIFFAFRFTQRSGSNWVQLPPLPSLPPPVDLSQLSAPSNEVLTSPVATFGTTSAYGATWGDTNVLVLKQGDTRTAIAAETNNTDGTPRGTFVRVAFSPHGSYLSYLEEYGEGVGAKVYDIKNKMTVLTPDEEGHFNPSETLYYTCFIDKFSGGAEARVYKVSNFAVKLDLLADIYKTGEFRLSGYQELSCTADVANNTLQFVFSGSGIGQENSTVPIINRIYNVNLTTGELQSVQ